MEHADPFSFSLEGRSVLVTGGASGIGAGITEMLAEAGAGIVIADIDEAGAVRQAARLTAHGYKAEPVQLNLADEASVVRACREIVEKGGAPWALVNNAGLQDRQLLLEGTVLDWDRTMTVNARGPFLMTREIARAMAREKRGGRIINIGSAAVIGAITMGHAAYAASKTALLGLMRAAALELAEHAITVNTVLPGGVMTPGAIASKGPAPDGPGRRRPPLGMCEPRDIGAAVVFLSSPAARFITNQVLAVDGGWSVT